MCALASRPELSVSALQASHLIEYSLQITYREGSARGDEKRQSGFVVLTSLEDVVPDDHPLRAIRSLVDVALEQIKPSLDALYAEGGRPGVAPEYLLRAQLIQILYAIASERRLVEQLTYNLLLRWFVGLPLDEPVWHATTFTKNRERLLNGEIAGAFFAAIRKQAEAHMLLSAEHFSLDGTLVEAAASLKEPAADRAERRRAGAAAGRTQPPHRLPRSAAGQ